MDGQEVLDAVKSAVTVELDRLGSEKALVAVTTANLERAAVMTTGAAAELRASETFAAWAGTESTTTAREAFESVAQQEADHYERVASRVDDAPTSAEVDALHDYLRGLDETPARIGAGLIGRPLVASRSLLQFVNYFVNEAAERDATMFREFRRETDETVSRGVTLLDTLYGDDPTAMERAQEAAIEAVQVAYEQYATQLEAMGIDPKPVC